MNSSNGTLAIQESLDPGTAVETGQVAIVGGQTTAFPDAEAIYVRFKASTGNAGDVQLHGESGASADGWPLGPGEETGLLPVKNLSLYGHSGTDGDIIHYEVIG